MNLNFQQEASNCALLASYIKQQQQIPFLTVKYLVKIFELFINEFLFSDGAGNTGPPISSARIRKSKYQLSHLSLNIETYF